MILADFNFIDWLIQPQVFLSAIGLVGAVAILFFRVQLMEGKFKELVMNIEHCQGRHSESNKARDKEIYDQRITLVEMKSDMTYIKLRLDELIKEVKDSKHENQ